MKREIRNSKVGSGKWRIGVFTFLLSTFALVSAQAQSPNVKVINPTSQPVPVLPLTNTSGTTAVTPTQGVKAISSAGTPVRLVAANTYVEAFEIHARKNVTTANTGNIYVGYSSTAGQNYRVLAPGETWGQTAPPGKKINLYAIYIDAATSADAVTYTAIN